MKEQEFTITISGKKKGTASKIADFLSGNALQKWSEKVGKKKIKKTTKKKICKKCGSKLKNNAKFCNECGAKLKK